MPRRGIYTVTVPGAVAGWDALRARFGTLPMSDLLAPAIFYAEDGFPVSDVIARALGRLDDEARRRAERARRPTSPNGRAPTRRRDVQESRAGGVAPADRRRRARRLLRGQDRRRDSRRSRASKAAR